MDAFQVTVFAAAVLIAVLVYWSQWRSRDFEVAKVTGASTQGVIDYVINTFTSRGFIIASNAGSTITFHRKREINYGLLIVLMLLGVVPAIIYLSTGSKDLVSTAIIKKTANGNTSVQIAGNAAGYGNGGLAKAVLQELPAAKH